MHHVILGAGPAGVIAAETLRKAAPADTITLVGGEAEAPYSRMAIPYLIAGNVAESGTHLRHGSDHFKQLRIDQIQGKQAFSVQYHPEASPGPPDSFYLFERFVASMA